ncbi:MAG: sugar transferase [Planctomycetota bacterium]
MTTDIQTELALSDEGSLSTGDAENRSDSAVEVAVSQAAYSTSSILARPLPAWKRVMDVVGVIVLAPLLVLPLVLVALYIRLVSRGPALFVQSRLGHGGEYFPIFKFRTMHVVAGGREEAHRAYVASHAESDEPIAKPDHSESFIPGGAFLRATSIDELPQLLNVLRGEMSLVGPRPDVLHREDYTERQLRRFEVHPGMTGLWQVSGKNELSFEEMIDLDLQYASKPTLKLDLWILLKTVAVLLWERNE